MSAKPKTKPVGEVTTWLSGGTPNRSRPDYWNGWIPWISASTLKTAEIRDSDQHISPEAVSTGSKMAPVNSTLLLVRGSALHKEIRAGLVIQPLAFNQDVKALIPNAAIVPKYLTHALRGSETELLKLVTSAGNTAGVLDTKVVQAFEIFIPPRSEQSRIVSAIDDVDRKILLLERLISKKEAIKQGIMQQLLSGRTRLPGFTGEWHRRPLGELLTYEQPGRYLVSNTEYIDSGVPVLTAGKTFLLGHTAERYGIYENVPVIIFDDFTTASKYVDFPFKAKSSAMKMLSARPGVNLRYMYERMQLLDFVAVDHKRRWIAEYSRIEVAVPEPEEQDAIAEILEGADYEINALKVLLSKSRAIKQGMMQQLLTGRVRLPTDDAS